MHEGNLKAKPVKGLYEYLIDLSQNDTKVLADILSTLELLLGPQWQKIYVSPQVNHSVLKATVTVPEANRAVADKLLDDFISDLGDDGPESITTVLPLTGLSAQEEPPEEPFSFVSSPQDQLAEIISENAREQRGIESATAAARDVNTDKLFTLPGTTAPTPQNTQHAALTKSPQRNAREAAVVKGGQPTVPVSLAPEAPVVDAHSAPIIERPQTPLISPADFRIERERRAKEVAPEINLRAFEASYLSKEATRKRYQVAAAVLLLCLAGGGWYLAKQKPRALESVVTEAPSPRVSALAPQPVTPAADVQKPVSTSQRPVPDVLPSFIPIAGLDRTFASQKPGWERYIGPDSEYRVFRVDGKIKAVQVLATKGHAISESRFKTILAELTGASDYRIISREQTFGFQVSRATVNRKADLLMYRKKSSLHAVVVSLD
jgi:flagellar FliL protein